MKWIFSIVIILLWIASGYAQEYHLQNYSMKDGLPHTNVYRVYQDRKGFIWLCTNNGLSKFDGKRFENYYIPKDYSSNCFLSITEDSYGNKYIGTNDRGLCILNNNSIQPIAPYIQTPQSVFYTAFYRDKLWLIGSDSSKQLYYIDRSLKLKKISAISENGEYIKFHKIIQNAEELYVTTSAGVYIVNNQNQLSKYLKQFNIDIIDIQKAKDESYWVVTENRVMNISNDKVKMSFSINDKCTISDILIDKNGLVWIATNGNGILLIKDNQLFSPKPLKIPHTIINDLFEDNEGNIWVATHGKGLYRFHTTDIINYNIEKGKVNVYCNALSSFVDKQVLVGSMGTVGLWGNDSIRSFGISTLQYDDFIYFIAHKDDQILVGTPNGLIHKNENLPYYENRYLTKGALSICIDSPNKIWVGSFNGVYIIENKQVLEEKALSGRRYNSIIKDHEGNLWLGTSRGVLIYKNRKLYKLYLSDNSLQNRVNCIYADSSDHIWLATDGGLFCIKDKKVIKTFISEDDLTGSTKCNALIQYKNNLWVGTLKGLCIIDLKSFQVSRPDFETNEVLSLLVSNDQLFVGTVNGLSIVNPTQRQPIESPPTLHIVSVIDGKRVLDFPDKIVLPYNHNKLSINYIGISYANSDNVEYRYKIIPLDNNWHFTKSNSIELSALQPGNYIFLISARHTNRKWSDTIRLPVFISTPFWKTVWFFVFMVFLAGSIIVIITKRNILKKETKKREKLHVYNKILYLKQQALSALMNPHFIFNCMNSIQYYLNKNEIEHANVNLSKFANLIRMNMENVQAVFIPLSKELNRVEIYLELEKLRLDEDFQYQIIVDPLVNIHEVKIPNMILQPYIENAIWHGIMPSETPGLLKIQIKKLDRNEFVIAIEDNGIGIKNKVTPSHKSMGMNLTKDRLALLNNLLRQNYRVSVLNPEYTTGTIIEIVLPVVVDETAFYNIQDYI